MSPKPALKREPSAVSTSDNASFRSTAAVPGPRRVSVSPIRPVANTPKRQPHKQTNFQARVPVITGEANYRGVMPVNGIITGQLGANGSALVIKQRPRNGSPEPEPELNGEITFKDMLRINGHVAGKIFSYQGTLIVDNSARVDADIDVAACVVSGTVNGDVVAQKRVELGPAAVINGNISTGSLSMRPGAIFTGNCRMLKNEDGDK
jgi:cytoskeletal protein CcmA (bactofilin family)